jgi:hypothetical protein
MAAMTTTDAPEPDRPETPGQSVDGEREKQAHAVVHGMRRWRGLVFVGTSLAALAAGAVLVQGAGRRDTRASASGLPVAAPEAGAGSLRLPPDVLREYQAQIAALASERTRAREGERRVHADHEALAALEMARLEQERRLQRLEERSVRPTPVLPEAREEVSAAGVDHQRSGSRARSEWCAASPATCVRSSPRWHRSVRARRTEQCDGMSSASS